MKPIFLLMLATLSVLMTSGCMLADDTRKSSNRISNFIRRCLGICLLLAWLPIQASAKITIHAEYHAPVNLFAIMDETAYWNPNFNDTAHREAWKKRFGWSDKDRAMVKLYKKYRQRTVDDSDQTNLADHFRQDGIFFSRSVVSPQADPLAQHFINSDTISEALSNLGAVVSNEDAEMLRLFYEHFRPKWLLLIKESEVFTLQAEALNNDLTGEQVDAYLARMSQFYGVNADLELKVNFIWWPPINRTLAYLKGQTFFLYRHPVHHAHQDDLSEVTMHETVHFISANQPSEQKRVLSKQFLDVCPAKSKNFYHLLEEPLAVAWGQAAFAKYGRNQPLDLSESWYRSPMPEVMGRLLWLHVDKIYETEETINDGIIGYAAEYCSRLLDISNTVKRKRRYWGLLGK